MTGTKQTTFETFEEFWPHYCQAHTRPACRGLHYLGTALALAAVAMSVAWSNPWLLMLAPALGYACAWVGHFSCEGNLPATFGYALYSLRADFRMVWLGLTGRMATEVTRHRVAEHLSPQDADGPGR